MNTALETLAQRAVMCPRWRWLPGMAYWWQGGRDRVADTEPGDLRRDGSLLPDLTDGATRGCLLALVREAHAPGEVWLERRHANGPIPGWVVWRDSEPHHRQALADEDTEAEALVAALEAAP